MKTYDPSAVDVIFGGLTITGFAEDIAEIDSAEEGYSTVVGADGIVTRVKNENTMCRVIFKLAQYSESNALLTAMYHVDRAAPGGAGVVPILIRDKNGTSLFASDKAWIVKLPPETYGKTATAREWLIDVADAKRFVGGG